MLHVKTSQHCTLQFTTLIFTLQEGQKLRKIIQDKDMWTHMCMIVRAFFPALLMLRLADSNCANMDKSYFYVRKLNQSLETSKQLLDLLPKETEYMKLTSNVRKDDWSVEEEESDGSDNDEAIDVEEAARRVAPKQSTNSNSVPTAPDVPISAPTLGSHFITCWNKRKVKLCHDFSMAGWIVSPIPHVYNDVNSERNQKIE